MAASTIRLSSPPPRMPIIWPPNASAVAGSNSVSARFFAAISVVVIDFLRSLDNPIVTLARKRCELA